MATFFSDLTLGDLEETHPFPGAAWSLPEVVDKLKPQRLLTCL